MVLPPSDEAEEFPDEPVKVVAEAEEKIEEPAGKKDAAPEKISQPAAPAVVVKKESGKFNTGGTIVGGISPAIVYLQNLKAQIEHFENEIHELRGQVSGFASAHDEQFRELLKRLTEMQKAQAAPPVAKPAPTPVPAAKPVPAPAAKPVPAPAAKPAPAPVAKPAPVPVAKPAPVPVAKPAPVPVVTPAPEVELKISSDAKPGIELSLDAGTPEPEKPKLAVRKPPPDQGDDDILKSTGKGPVWPV